MEGGDEGLSTAGVSRAGSTVMKIGCTLRGAGRIARLEPAQAGADHLHVDRADVGTEGVAEIDDAVFAGEVAVADLPAVLVGEGERPAHRRALERRRVGRRRAQATGSSASSRRERNCEAAARAFVHDSHSLALLRRGDQAE